MVYTIWPSSGISGTKPGAIIVLILGTLHEIVLTRMRAPRASSHMPV